MFANLAGIYTLDKIPRTTLERTLIDITVRPIYSGGVNAVLDAYKKSIGKVSVKKIIAILDTINFIYPYYQAVGFYLEKAGYKGK